MPILVEWDAEENQTLLICFEGALVWQEMYDIRDYVRYVIEQSPGTAHVVYDLTVSRTPQSNATPHLRNFVANLPASARQGLHVFVNASPNWKAHVTVFMRLYPDLTFDHVYVSSVADARGAIRRKKEQSALLDEPDKNDDSEPDCSRPPTDYPPLRDAS
jgi:hypothetical protein